MSKNHKIAIAAAKAWAKTQPAIKGPEEIKAFARQFAGVYFEAAINTLLDPDQTDDEQAQLIIASKQLVCPGSK